ncbi:sensor histidine kinase [Nonomuraea sp. CA-141351]|uniref:sensor histidine kinase n=1 Tax=Nonomuraea sp. CA-141351 TaxID=3239996 RepID=UPI003D8AB21E
MTKPEPPIRVRLTLLYTCLFAVGGAILVVITYVLVAALPTAESSTIQLPDGGVSRSWLRMPDRQAFEPICRQALATKDADLNLRDKCASAYQIWGAQDQHDATLSHLVQYSATALAAVVALAASAGWVAAGRVLRPVHQIAAAARTAAEHIANASHELRTPLSLMRTTVDVVLAKPAPTSTELRAMAHDVRDAVDNAEALVEALLTLARNERGLTVHEDVDLATVAEDVLDSVDLLDRQPHTSLQPAITSGDPLLLERLVANLVDNAVRYNHSGGDVWVTTCTVKGRPTVVVANTGPVIAPDAVDDLFQPFHRLNDRTTNDGFGLGLAIVASIAAMHHGAVRAYPRPEGGIHVVLTLP